MGANANPVKLLLSLGLILAIQSGCARSIHGHAGEKGMQPAHDQPGVAAHIRSQHARGGAAEDVPSLSHFEASNLSMPGHESGEERIPNDVVALSPSLSSGSVGGAHGEALSPEERRQGERLAALAGLQDVFFGYDSAIVSNEARERLLHAARWLQDDRHNTLLIEGHCDERGTIAYNLVLGEKRARAVVNFLRDQRLEDQRLIVVSYGKERPFCRNHDEPCYRQNRRGHFVVRR